MTTDHTTDDLLDSVLADYFQRLDQGQAVSPASLLASHPELETELREFFDAATFVENLAGPTQAEQTQMLSVHDTARNSLVGETIVSGVQTAPRDQKAKGENLPQHFGRYEIQRLLGQGAMGSVYLAYDPSLQRKIALKIPKFSDEFNSDKANPDMRDRFLREARSAATLRHANICPVYDVGRVDGVHYITMAYIEGRTLAEELRAGRTFEPREIATIVRKLALALGKAHSAGVIHRDLKPGNIMLDAEGEPVLMDFGLAYREETDELRLTKSGMIVGSPAYMSPEQIEGDPAKIGSGSDIYSLGVVLYEMITGKLPFQGTMMSVIGQIAAKEPTPIGQYRPELANSPLERLCRKMLAKQIGDRPQTMQEVARALDYILSGLPDARGQESEVGGRESASRQAQPQENNDLRLPIPDPRPPTPVAQVVKFPEAVLAQERRERAKMFLATTLILVTLLGLFGAAAGIVYVATDQGTLEITSHVDNVKIEVIGDNGAVRVIDLTSGTTVERLKSGNYTVVVQGNDSRVAIDKGKFQITRGSKVAVTAHLVTSLTRPAQVAEAERKLPTDSPSTNFTAPASKPASAPLAQFASHRNEVRGVAFSPDDRQFVTVGWDRMICLYDTPTKKLIHTWQGHSQGIYRARYLPDGRLLTSAYDGTIKLWDVSKRDELKRFTGHSGAVTALAVSADGKRALSAGSDMKVRFWDLEKLEPVGSGYQVEQGQWIWDAAFAPDGNSAATVGFDGKLRLWNAENGEQIAEIVAHQGAALSIVYVGDNKVLTGGRDGMLRLWDPATKTKIGERAGFSGVWIESLSISKDGAKVLAGLANPDKQEQRSPLAGQCAVLDRANLKVLGYLSTGAPYVYATALSSDGSLALIGTGRGGEPASAQLWDLSVTPFRAPAANQRLSITESVRFRGHEEYVLSVAFTKDDKLLASTGADHKIIFWDPATGQPQPTKKLHTDDVRAIAFTPDDSRFVTASNDRTLLVWNAETREVQATLRGHKSSATAVVILEGGQRAISASDDQALILWDLVQANPIFLAGFHKAAVSCLALSPDGKLIASAGKDNLVILSEVQADKLVLKHKMSGHTGEIRGLAFSPDGRHVISGARDGTVRFWTVATGRQYKTFAPGMGIVYSVAVSPDGQYLAIGGGDWTKGSIKIYAFPSGRQLAEVRDFLGFVHALAFTKDSATLAAGSADKHVRLFRLGAKSQSSESDASITEVLQIPGHAEHVTSLAVTGDGQTIVSGSADGTVLARDIEPRLTRRAMSGHRRDRQVYVDVSRDGRLIVSGDWDGKLRLNDSSKGVTEIAAAHAGGVMSVKLSPDQTKLLTTGGDQTIKVWNAATGELLQTFSDAGWLSDGEFSPSGELAVTSGFDGQLKIRQIGDGLVVKDLPTGGAMISCVSWSPRGDRIAAGLRDATVRVFSAETGLETVRMVGHADRVRDVVFTLDGKHLISGSYDRTMRVWNVETGAEVAKVEHEKHIFNALAIAPDGQHVFSAGGIWKPDEEKNEWTPENDYAIRMWRLPALEAPANESPAPSPAASK